MNFRATFATGALFLASALHPQVTIEQLAADERLWSQEVRLTQAVPL